MDLLVLLLMLAVEGFGLPPSSQLLINLLSQEAEIQNKEHRTYYSWVVPFCKNAWEDLKKLYFVKCVFVCVCVQILSQ